MVDASTEQKKTFADAANPQEEKKLTVDAQYVKDISFEVPQGPAIILQRHSRPQINVSVEVEAKPFAEDRYEIILKIGANAVFQDEAENKPKTMFVLELSYAGCFTVKNIEKMEKQALLLIYCPNMLFPFARRIVADMTRDGGFPPLMLDPVDFAALFQNSLQKVGDVGGRK